MKLYWTGFACGFIAGAVGSVAVSTINIISMVPFL